MNAVFDPSILFIDYYEWLNEESQTKFLEHFNSLINLIHTTNNISIYFTDEMQNKQIYNALYSPPYINDRDWGNKMIPILARFFIPHIEIVDVKDYSICDHRPTFNCINSEIKEEFLKILHLLIIRKEEFYLCIGLPNLPISNSLIFDCTCHKETSNHKIVKTISDLLKYINNLSDLFYPTELNQIDRFRIGLRFCAIKFFNSNVVFNYGFNKSFINSIMGRTNKDQIMWAISLRLTITQKEAAINGSLQDENFTYKGVKIRRMRVSENNRIHYNYDNNGKIIFLDYFGEGEYDNAYK